MNKFLETIIKTIIILFIIVVLFAIFCIIGTMSFYRNSSMPLPALGIAIILAIISTYCWVKSFRTI